MTPRSPGTLFVANSAALIAPFSSPTSRARSSATRARSSPGVRPTPRAPPPSPGGYRVSGSWDFASGCRHANWMGAHCHVAETDGSLRLNRFGRPVIRTLLFPVRAGDPARHLEHHRPARHRLRQLSPSRTSSSPKPSAPRARSPSCAASAVRSTPSRCRASTPSAWPAWRWASRGRCSTSSSRWPSARPRAPVAAGRQRGRAGGRGTRAKRRLGAARAYLLDTLATIYAQADDIEPIGLAERARVRLACTNAIHGAIEVADYTYKAAGVDAIFPGSPFERRFRDIHTLSQQIQSRDRPLRGRRPGAARHAAGSVLLDRVALRRQLQANAVRSLGQWTVWELQLCADSGSRPKRLCAFPMPESGQCCRHHLRGDGYEAMQTFVRIGPRQLTSVRGWLRWWRFAPVLNEDFVGRRPSVG